MPGTRSVFKVGVWQYRSGDTVEATVLKVMPFGVFVELSDGNRGVIRRRELSWDRDLSDDDLLKIVSVGDKIEPVILGPDDEHQRLMLSLRRAEYDPWDRLQKEEGYKSGAIVRGEVVSLKPYGAFVELEEPEGAVGLLHISQIPGGEEKEIGDLLWVGDHVEAAITEIDPVERRLRLSITRRLAKDRMQREQRTGNGGRSATRDPLVRADEETEELDEIQDSDEPEITLHRTGNIDKILLVDDEEEFANAFRSLLEKLGYAVDSVGTGEEGVKQGITAEHDLILLDVHLPDVDGIEVARRILADRPGAKIVIVTGIDWLERDVDTSGLDLVGVLLKPLDSDEVIRILQALETGQQVQTTGWTVRAIGKEDEFFRQILASTRVSSPLNAKLNLLLGELRRVTGAEAGFVFRMDLVSRDVSVLAESSSWHEDEEHEEYENTLKDLQYSPIKDVAWGGETILENNVIENAEARFTYLLRFVYFESCIGIPLSMGEEGTRYALFLFHPETDHFTDGDLEDTLLMAKAIELAFERDRLERLIQEQQRLMLTGQLGLSLVHEINNKLTGIEQNAKNLQLDYTELAQKPTVCQSSSFLKRMNKKIGNLLRIGKDLRELNLAYLGLVKSEETEAVSIGRTILQLEALVEPLARKRGIRISTDLSSDFPSIKSVPLRLEQVFLNLMLNAIQHMEAASVGDEVPELRVITSYEPTSERPVKVRFKDDGLGIHRQQFDWVFEMGTGTRVGGAGLGLFVSKGLTESLGGKLSIEDSVMFVGTTFLVELPFIPVEEAA
jgi:signal transduction histidine kinase/predicted RNA-binding protein with RPS1 domain/DNA-binding response OmpR family regulator